MDGNLQVAQVVVEAVVAAIKTKKDSLSALTAVALSLPGVGGAEGLEALLEDFPVHSPGAEYQYMHYEEGDGRMEADIHHSALSIGLFDRLKASVSYNVDIYSGATPGYSVPDSLVDIVTSATGTVFAV